TPTVVEYEHRDEGGRELEHLPATNTRREAQDIGLVRHEAPPSAAHTPRTATAIPPAAGTHATPAQQPAAPLHRRGSRAAPPRVSPAHPRSATPPSPTVSGVPSRRSRPRGRSPGSARPRGCGWTVLTGPGHHSRRGDYQSPPVTTSHHRIPRVPEAG